MDWQFRLIEVYDKTCDLWKQGLCFHAERLSNNKEQLITDEEIVAIFLNGIMTGKTNLKSIYNFTVQHLHGWFPQYPISKISELERLNACETDKKPSET